MNNKMLAAKLARKLFELGDEHESPCQRIEFKGGNWELDEVAQGGCCESSLQRFFEGVLPELVENNNE